MSIKGRANDDMDDFAALAEVSFSFWNNEADDIYQKFYVEKLEI